MDSTFRKVLIIITNTLLLVGFAAIIFLSKDSLSPPSQDGTVKIHFFNSAHTSSNSTIDKNNKPPSPHYEEYSPRGKPVNEIYNDPFIKEMSLDREGASFFLTNEGVVPGLDARKTLLCKLKQEGHCKTHFIAESVDLMWAFAPIYSSDQRKMPLMYKHHQNFVSYMKSFGIRTIVLEAIYPGQEYIMTKAGNDPYEIQLEINNYFYYRENLLNVAIRKTKHLDYEYIIWIDAHQVFLNSYWWEEAIYKMAHYSTVSFFQSLVFLNQVNNRTIAWSEDMAGVQYALQLTEDIGGWVHADKGMWNGNAVGIRKDIYDELEYILDFCIAGCCDCAFNSATMVTHYDRLSKMFQNYGQQLLPWIEDSRKVLAGKNAIVRGEIKHLYHEHSFGTGGTFDRLKNENISLMDNMYRDSNFTLHIKEGSILNELFKKIVNIH